jgi:2-polyprenyl-3-methyl-5-hydroxy-6-metoxy-1,4-benzoquinol methylase
MAAVTLPAGYFEQMYDASPDPWSFRTRWYEQRKREVTLAALPRRRYARAFEPGCSIGLLTEGLARRCDWLLATDASATAVAAARRYHSERSECSERCELRIEHRALPDGWPREEAPFDLVVLSEIGYYFDDADLATVLDDAIGSLAPGGTLLVCHWRHRVADYPLTGDAVHEAVQARRVLHRAVCHDEVDFLLDVFTLGDVPSVAQDEGLAP